MKTAIKVINDRINILQQFIEKNKESKEPGVKVHRDAAVSVMLLFSQLQDAIDEHSRLINAGQVNEELVDTIKALLSQTMVPLIERNKQIIASYNDMLGVLIDKKSKVTALQGPGGSTQEFDDINTTISLYETSKTSTIYFLSEYEVAFEEIKEMLIGDEVQSAINIATESVPHINDIMNEEEKADHLKKIESGEIVVKTEAEKKDYFMPPTPPNDPEWTEGHQAAFEEMRAIKGKKDMVNRWKDAFKSEAFLQSHSNRYDDISPNHRDVITDEIGLRIVKNDNDAVIFDVSERQVYHITHEEFQELFDLYESIPKIPVSEEESVSASIPQEEEKEQVVEENVIEEENSGNPKEPKIYDANSNENDEVN
jgi:hypothetical protein